MRALLERHAHPANPLSDAELARLASLSGLATDASEARALQRDVAAMIGWTAQIQGAATDGVQPMVSPLDSHPLRLRADAVTEGSSSEQTLANARHKDRGFFVVPKVVDLEEA